MAKALILALVLTVVFAAPDYKDPDKIMGVLEKAYATNLGANQQNVDLYDTLNPEEQETYEYLDSLLAADEPSQDLEMLLKQFDNPEDKIAFIMRTYTCTVYCQSADRGDGVIIGTAPFCGASCKNDCQPSDRLCTIGTPNMADYGAKCWSGNKVCCCAK